MAGTEAEERAEKVLQLCLRVVATVTLFAAIFIVVPYSWMNAIHSWAGLGELPEQPIVGYLARSSSALYTILAGVVWVVSFDLRRYRDLLSYFCWAVTIFGITILAIDFAEGMPISWTLSEGPMLVVFGIALYFMIRKANL